ncbi:MAG TPA: ABC transporter substrate-binding protein [Rectinemataceae bacterium]|nr:ABC transporter substrate-binding protein [Rectinemataceae bacterium]
MRACTRSLAVLLGISVALIGCVASNHGANTIKIGWLGALTGDNADWGQSELNTIRMMLDDVDAHGGLAIAGKPYRLVLISYDDHGDATAATDAAKRLTANDHVNAIVGPMFSREAIPVSQIVEAAATPCIATTATNPAATVVNNRVNPYMFRACFIDPYQGQVAATYAYRRLGKKTAAILVKVDDAYSLGLGEYFNENFRWLGGKVLASVSYNGNDVNFAPQLATIKAAQPDMIFAPVFDKDIALIAKQARRLGINTVMMGGDGWPSTNLLPMAGGALEGCYYVNHLDFDDPAVKSYKDAYTAAFGKPPEMPGYLAHDAVLMLLDGLKRAQSLDGATLAKALESCDIQGITGHIKIGKATHNPEGKEAAIIKIMGDKMLFQEKFAAALQQ